MIGIYHHQYDYIPLLEIVQSDKKDLALPVFTYFHGFTSAKEYNLPLAYFLAEKGYRVILPDSLHHGGRTSELSPEERQFQFWNIVMQNIKDLLVIKETLDNRELILDHRFGIGGTSMGGITTCAALTKYPWITASAVLMGSPKPAEFAMGQVNQLKEVGVEFPLTEEQLKDQMKAIEAIDLSKQMDKLGDRPLFFWHGEEDQVVPFEHSYSFHQEARAYYTNPEQIKFQREVGRGHKVSPFAISEAVKWIENQL